MCVSCTNAYMWYLPISEGSPYIWVNLCIWNFKISLYTFYISLFGISDLPTKFQEFPSLFNHSPYLERQISLFVFPDVSHVCECHGLGYWNTITFDGFKILSLHSCSLWHSISGFCTYMHCHHDKWTSLEPFHLLSTYMYLTLGTINRKKQQQHGNPKVHVI